MQLRPVFEIGDAPRDDLIDVRPACQQGLAQSRLPRDQRLTLKQLAERLEVVVLGFTRKGPGESFPPGERSVDLRAGVVILQEDRHLMHSRQPPHGLARVRGHQEREVRRTLGRRQPQHHLDVAIPGHLDRADEPKRRDRLVKLGVEDRVERREDALAGGHAVSTSCASSLAPGVPPSFSRNSAGTSMPYSLAALRPRIFRFVVSVTGG